MASRLTRRELERLTGFFNFAAQYLRLGKLFLKPIVLWMNRNTSVALRDRYVLLDDSLREALIPWMDPDFLRCPIPIRRHPFSKTLMTDASLDAWSGILLPHSVRGPWPPEWEGMSMNWKELKAVHLSLIRFQNQLKGHCVRILSDSTTALACIRKEGSLASEALWDLAKDLLLFAQSKDISLYPVHLRGRLNVLADKASRDGLISTEWSLDRGSFKRICEVWGVPLVDLFATRENSQLPQFVSPCPDPWALGCDALDDSLDWNQLRSIYLFPPFQLIEEVL